MDKEKCAANPFRTLGQCLRPADLQGAFVSAPTAVLVVHGVGNQQPMETIDHFARTLAETYRDLGCTLRLSHGVRKRRTRGGELCFDNYVRIRREGSPHPIDVYEYYWANLTEDCATARDVRKWVAGTARGAAQFYARQAALGQAYCDRSAFFRKSDGAFRAGRYRLALNLIARVMPAAAAVASTLLELVGRIPFIGPVAAGFLRNLESGSLDTLVNLMGDVIVYNTTDAKSKFYEVRRAILDGAVESLRRLIEPESDGVRESWPYDRVMLVGHSLGSQVAFDALNRLNQLIAQGELKGFRSDGCSIEPKLAAEPDSLRRSGGGGSGGCGAAPSRSIKDVLAGLVTFGSPLDKVAFFLRDQVEDEQWVRRQMLAGFHAFKQRDWALGAEDPFELEPPYPRLLEDLPWMNYFDRRDFVSGCLDYYHRLTNVDCAFESGHFTHAQYWNSTTVYREIIQEMLHAPIAARAVRTQAPVANDFSMPFLPPATPIAAHSAAMQ